MMDDIPNWVGLDLADGRYRVRSMLGEGGMAYVYRAIDLRLECDVVLKVPKPSILEKASFAGRFAQEIRSLVQLSHPHIVKVTDVGEHEDLPFAVMQYLPGGSLKDRLQARPDGTSVPTPAHELRDWVEEVADALDFIHKQGYVHRDVKPENILFDGHGAVYLSDFGVVKALAHAPVPVGSPLVQTGAHSALGSPPYMAPELIMEEGVDGRSDQYSLAVTIYQLLCGELPFDGPSAAAIFVQHISEAPCAPHVLVPTIPEAISLAVLKALSKDPKSRYPSCAAFARALLAALEAARSGSGGRSSRPLHSGPAKTEPVTRALGALTTCPTCGRTFTLPAGSKEEKAQCPSCRESAPPSGNKANGFHPPPATARQSRYVAGWHDWVQRLRRPWSGRFSTLAPRMPSQFNLRERSRLLVGMGVAAAAVLLIVALLLLTRGNTGPREGTLDSDSARLAPAFLSISAQPDGAPTTYAGGKRLTVHLSVKRQNWEGPVQIQAAGVPEGVTVEPVTLPPDRSNVDIVFTAQANAPATPTPVAVQIRATAGDLHAQCECPCIVERLACKLKDFDLSAQSVVLAADGQHAVAGGDDKVVRWWDIDSAEEPRQFHGHTAPVRSVAISRDGRRIVSGSQDRTVRLWDTATGQELHRFPHNAEVRGVAISGDGRRIWSGSADGKVRLWDADSGQPLLQKDHPGGPVFAVALTADGRRGLSGGEDGVVWLWDLSNGQAVRSFEGHKAAVRSLGFAADGRRAISGGTDKQVFVWDVDRGTEVHHLRDLLGPEFGAAISPDGQRILFGSPDNTLRLWDVDSGKELELRQPFRAYRPLSVAFGSHGRLALASTENKSVLLFGMPR